MSAYGGSDDMDEAYYEQWRKDRAACPDCRREGKAEKHSSDEPCRHKPKEGRYAWMRPKPFPKPSRTARKIEEVKAKNKLRLDERNNKAEAKRRDGNRCRWPLCGCRRLGLVLQSREEVSHDQHKGMGGNPSGGRSAAERMITFCFHRHQDGIISRHKGTLRTVYLTDKMNNGAVEFEVDAEALADLESIPDIPTGKIYAESGRLWVTVARETSPGQLMQLTDWQRAVLNRLAEMDI